MALRPTFDVYGRRELLQAIVFDEPRPPSKHDRGIPAELETIVLKCLQKSPADRYATAKELAEDLWRFTSGMPILARPIGRAERFRRWCRRNPAVSGLSAAVAVVLVAWAVTMTVMAIELRDARDTAEASAKAEKTAADEARNQTILANIARSDAEKAAQREKSAAEDAMKKEAVAVSKTQEAQTLSKLIREQRQKTITILSSLINRKELSEVAEKLVFLECQKFANEVESTEGVTKFTAVAYWGIMSDILLKRGRGVDALGVLNHGYGQIQKIVEEGDASDLARANLGVLAHSIGKVYLEFFDDPRQALPHLLEGRELQQEIADHPRTADYSDNDNDRILSIHQVYVGMAQARLGNLHDARHEFETALAHRRDWLARDPTSVPSRSYISECELWLANVCAHLGDQAGVERHFGEALKICHELAGRFPNDFSFKADLAQVYGDYGDVQLRSGNVDAASSSYQKSLGYQRAVVAHVPDDLSRKPQLADALERTALVAERRQDGAAAKTAYDDARQIRAQLVEADPKNFAWRLAYARALAHCGQTIEANGQATTALDEAGDRPSSQLQAARVFAVCAAKNPSSDERANDPALDALERALPDDFHDPYVIRTDPDLASLAGNERFKDIVARVLAPAKEGE